jgi:predicted nucleic acid-binding protein
VTRILVDTNVLVSFLTDRDMRQQALAAALFEQAADGAVELVLHQVAIMELAYVLRNRYGVDAAAAAQVLRELLALPGAVTVDALPWSALLELWPAKVAGLADAVLGAVCRAERCDAVATFDADLQRDLKRLGLGSFW